MNQITIQVSGMSCQGCVKAVTAALKNTNGVKTAEVSLEKNIASVEYDPAVVTPEELVQAIEEAGYGASV